MNDERPTTMATPDTSVELRGDCPREIVDVIDAISQARRLNRMALVNEILGDWVAARLHEISLVQRVTQSNPPLVERSARGVEVLRKGRGE